MEKEAGALGLWMVVEYPGVLSIERWEDTRRGAGLSSSLDQGREGKAGVARRDRNSERDKEVGLEGTL